ncbi:hypothetical protein MTO96_007629 [Rhipicephalus appendiculatus]
MALTEQHGYDPTTLSWSSIPTNQPEDGPSTISAEQADIFQLVEGRRRRRKNAGGASAPRTPVNNPVMEDACVQSPKASQKTPSPVSKWTPKPTASAARAQDIGAPSKTEAPAPGKAATATLPPGAAESPALSAPIGNAARNQPKGSEAVPAQTSAFLPIFLLPLLQLPGHPDGLSAEPMVLCELAAAILVLASERTMAVDHFVLRVLEITGTRMRNLAVLCAAMAVFCSVLLDTSASVLVVGAVIAAVVRAIQDDAVQGYHQRALFDKATRLLPAMRRRQLENMLWPQSAVHGDADLPPEMMGAVSLCESPLLSVDTTEGASLGESTEEALWDFIMYSTEFTAKTPRDPKHAPPAQPAYPTRSSLWDPQRAQRAPKRTSFLEDGAVVFPGNDSPLPKPGYGNADESR